MPRTRLTALSLLLVGAPGAAQSELATFTGAAPGDHHAVVLGGVDLDGDGFDDLVVGAPDDDTAGPGAGAVYAYSGQTHGQLWAQYGNAPIAAFGYSLALSHDLDGDGVRDVVAGAPFAQLGASSYPGHVRVLSGADGAVIFTGWGDDHNEGMGWSVAGSFQWNGSKTDFAGGAPLDDDGGVDSGSFRVWSGDNGMLLATVPGVNAGDLNGWSMSHAFDVDFDGSDDLVVGAPNADFVNANVGWARVFGFGGAVIWTKTGFVTGDLTGWSVAGLGDVTGDNYADVLVGEPGNGDNGPLAGRVRLFSGQNSFQLGVWRGDVAGDRFGSALAAVGSLGAAPLNDFGVGATQIGTGAGYVRVIAGGLGSEIFTVTGEAVGDEFGSSVTRAGFFDAGLFPDIAVGARNHDGPAGSNTGMARVFSGACPGFVTYCTSGVSANGCQAWLLGIGTPSASNPSSFWIAAQDVEPGKDGLYFFGTNGRQANPWGNGTSYQCVLPPVKRAGLLAGQNAPPCGGSFTQDLNEHWTAFPNKRPTAGDVVQAQLWYRDPQNTSNQTTSLSNALEFVVCP